jgi:hypothetical protein
LLLCPLQVPGTGIIDITGITTGITGITITVTTVIEWTGNTRQDGARSVLSVH